MDSGSYLATRLYSELAAHRCSRWRHACRISASGSFGRRVARELTAGSGSLCLSVWRAYLLDLLRFALHDRFSDFRHFARHWLVSWGDYRREHDALWRPRGRHGPAGSAHRLHCLARESRSHGPLHLRECHDRVQMRRGAFSSQHTIAEAFRISWRTWKLLGKHRLLLQTPQRNEHDVIVSRRNCARTAYPWENFSQTQTGRALRCHRRHYCCIDAFFGDARREINWRRTAGDSAA